MVGMLSAGFSWPVLGDWLPDPCGRRGGDIPRICCWSYDNTLLVYSNTNYTCIVLHGQDAKGTVQLLAFGIQLGCLSTAGPRDSSSTYRCVHCFREILLSMVGRQGHVIGLAKSVDGLP